MSGRKIRVGINGFGRIGRLVLRSAYRVPEIEVVAINTRRIHEDYMCYQFKYDSTHGRYKGTVEFDDNTHHLIVDGKKIKVHMHPDPTKIPWADDDVDIVIESSGITCFLLFSILHLHDSASLSLHFTYSHYTHPCVL